MGYDRYAAILIALAAAACQPVPVGTAPLSGLRLVPAPGGLNVEGSDGREIGFGRDQLGALQTIARIEGAAPQPVACSPDKDAFVTKGNLRLIFAAGAFVGWDSGSARAGRTCD